MAVGILIANGSDDGKSVKRENPQCHYYVASVTLRLSWDYLLANMPTAHQSIAFDLNAKRVRSFTFRHYSLTEQPPFLTFTKSSG